MFSEHGRAREWPVVVDAGRLRHLVTISTLEPAAKRRAWDRIQRHHPALATLLRDPAIHAIRGAFDGELAIDAEILEEHNHEQ